MKEDITTGSKVRYRRLWILLVVLMCLVSITPLIILTFFNLYQYEDVFTAELSQQVTSRLSNTKQALEFFIDERIAAITFLINDNSFEELSSNKRLTNVLSQLKKSFEGFIDLGLIDSEGNHRSYAGPYELYERNYIDQQWFQEVKLHGLHVSDVFMGFRKFPHFVVAKKFERDDGTFYILRATLNAEILYEKIHALEYRPHSDGCLINRAGILQTPSIFYGDILDQSSREVPRYSKVPVVNHEQDSDRNHFIFGYAYIEHTPFIFLVTKRSKDFMTNLLEVRTFLMWFLVSSIIIILVVIFWSTSYMVKRIYKADINQAKVLHNIQYTNKMASIGRLAAGVAHEINNPLAIINEKAGLIKDFATLKEDFRYKEKVLDLVGSVVKSVERCSVITHRLLSFAKRMDVNWETIDLELLLKEVIGFLEREAGLRNITIDFKMDADLPSIDSDRGQLQQVFLNILTNAFYAVEDGGQLKVFAKKRNDNFIDVVVEDNGEGISKENLDHIFEPFFTTKGEYGTGLGLSITYGIVQKLGGQINVESELGKGTTFTVTLPLKS